MERNMVICLDESGLFEKTEKRIRFNGGFLYEGENWESEEIRIQELLKEKCAEKGLTFPNALHDYRGTGRLSESFKESLSYVRNELLDYMKKRGKFRFIAILHKGAVPSDASAGDVADDRNGSNFYENMLSRILTNLLTCVPEYMPDTIDARIEVATRVITCKKTERENIEFHHKMGYDYKDSGDEIRFYLTKQQTVKTILSRHIRDNGYSKININSILVESINYLNAQQGQGGLYASDLCCEYIRSLFSVKDKLPNKIAENETVMKEVLGKPPILFVYDEADEQWGRLVSCYHRHDYFSFLDIYQQMEDDKSQLGKFYFTRYAAKLISFIEDIPGYALADLYEEVRKRCFFTGYYKRAQRILELLYHHRGAEDTLVLFKTAEMLMQTYIHMGDNKKASEYREKCKECTCVLENAELYINFQNRCISHMANEFRFREASELVTELYNAQGFIWRGKNEAAMYLFKNPTPQPDLVTGKLRSTAGQINAFLGNYKESKIDFEAALGLIDDPENRRITLSYLLHMAICSNNRQLYQQYESDYYGLKTAGVSRRKLLIDEFDIAISSRFELFVYLKALYKFYADDPAHMELLSKIALTDYSERHDITLHPFGLIYKYLTLLAKKAGFEKERNEFYKKAEAFGLETELTLRLIQKAALVELSPDEDKEAKNLELGIFIEEICKRNEAFREHFQDVLDAKSESTDYTRYFTYMYN